MKRSRLIPLLTLIVPLLAPAGAAAEAAPPIVRQGLDAYASDGAAAAVRAWLRGSPLESSKGIEQVQRQLQVVEMRCGGFRGSELLTVEPIGSKTRDVTLVLEYERCPLFARMLTYRSESGWLLTQINMNTKPEIVIE